MPEYQVWQILYQEQGVYPIPTTAIIACSWYCWVPSRKPTIRKKHINNFIVDLIDILETLITKLYNDEI